MSKQWSSSTVMQEFEKIAAESKLIVTDLNPDKKDFVGNPSKETPVKDHRRYEPTEEYGVTKGEGKDLVDKAHPKTIEMASAMGGGGVVENIVQQQEIDLEVATKMPHGALHGIHAELIQGLVEKANELEDKGKVKEAKRIDETIQRLSSFPFVNDHLVKEAAFGLAIWLLTLFAPVAWSLIGRSKSPGGRRGPRIPMGKGGKAAVILGGAATIMSAFGNKITSRKEDLSTDLKDLYDILLLGHSKGSASCKKAADLLKPFINKLAKPLDDKGFKKLLIVMENLKPVFPKIEKLVARSAIEFGPGRWYQFGLDITSRIQEKYNDFSEVYKETNKLIADAQGLGKRMDNTAKKMISGPAPTALNDVAKLQKVLFGDNSSKVTGKMDMETITATEVLEQNIDNMLSKIGIKHSVKGKIVQNGKMIMEFPKLEKMLKLIDLSIEKQKAE
jgi:hypothetical protein